MGILLVCRTAVFLVRALKLSIHRIRRTVCGIHIHQGPTNEPHSFDAPQTIDLPSTPYELHVCIWKEIN